MLGAKTQSTCISRIHHYVRVYVVFDSLTPVAGLNLLPGKSLRFPELFLGILPSEFRFTVLFPGAVEWIHKSPTAIFGQPLFLTNI